MVLTDDERKTIETQILDLEAQLVSLRLKLNIDDIDRAPVVDKKAQANAAAAIELQQIKERKKELLNIGDVYARFSM